MTEALRSQADPQGGLTAAEAGLGAVRPSGCPAGEARKPGGPLAGLVVLDLGQAYQGPYAGFLMAKAGAEVIRVEPPHGDSTRQRAKVRLGALLPNAMLNANKRGVTLNLKTERGRALMIEMARRSDVLIENFAPGVMDRLGIGWETMHQANPRLVYASGTGFGLTGPDRDRLAMDIIVQAYSGVMSVTGFPGNGPVKAGIAAADFLGGTHLYGAILTALYQRQQTGRGCLVEVAMQETIYPTLASSLGLIHGHEPATTRTGNHHSGLSVAPWSVYEAQDGHVAIVCVKDNHWHQLAMAMEQPELQTDPRFVSNADRCRHMDALDTIIGQWACNLLREQIVDLATRFRFPAAPVRTLAEIRSDKGMHERGMLETVMHPELGETVLPNSPLRIHGAETPMTTPSPRLGEHCEEVYRDWLGVDAAQLQALRAQGVI